MQSSEVIANLQSTIADLERHVVELEVRALAAEAALDDLRDLVARDEAARRAALAEEEAHYDHDAEATLFAERATALKAQARRRAEAERKKRSKPTAKLDPDPIAAAKQHLTGAQRLMREMQEQMERTRPRFGG